VPGYPKTLGRRLSRALVVLDLPMCDTLRAMAGRQYLIFHAMADDQGVPGIYIDPAVASIRRAISVTNVDSGRKIWCMALPLDANYRHRYNSSNDRRPIEDVPSSVVIGGWYRGRLALQPFESSDSTHHPIQQGLLLISEADGPYGHFRANLMHPDAATRTAAALGYWSILLALVAIALGVFALLK
jgi:hypothetical protein